MHRILLTNRILCFCTILWAQTLIGQTTGQEETVNHKRVAGARPDEGARLGSKLGASSWRGNSAKRGVPRRVKQEELELMRILTMANWPEWSDAQLDSAAEVWLQWWVGGAPREAAALVILSPEQQFALEIYQSQFGWPRDSSEWRAITLRTDQRELLQRLYHQPRDLPNANQSPWSLSILDPKISAGWSCSDCGGIQSLQKRMADGGSLALQSGSASWLLNPWLIRSPSDLPLRFWGSARSVTFALQPRLNFLWPAWTRQGFDRILIARDSSGMVMVDVGLRKARWAASMAWGSRGWLELAAVWYGPGGLLLSVQRDLSRNYGSVSVERPAAVATPWRPLRGNRATAALPLWAGRLTLNATTHYQSASWADRTRSISWYPGQLQIGIRHELLSHNSANQSLQKNPQTPSSSPSLRGIIYLGNAEGASIQFRWPLRTHSLEFGLAGITASTEILARATGPMTLWRPGITQEVAWQCTNGLHRISARIRQSPSGWSASVRLQLDLTGHLFRQKRNQATKNPQPQRIHSPKESTAPKNPQPQRIPRSDRT